MRLTLDHIFIIGPGRPDRDAAALARAGLPVVREAAHEGQGTANICFGLGGAYLELLYITDGAAARSAAVNRTRLWERAHWARTGVSPLGVCLRRAEGGGGEWPVPTWAYRAPFLPAGDSIPVAEEEEGSVSPLLFFAASPRPVIGGGSRRAAAVRVECPRAPRWAGVVSSSTASLVVAEGPRHAANIELEGRGERSEEVRLSGGLVTLRL
jgi:hypothetical protein